MARSYKSASIIVPPGRSAGEERLHIAHCFAVAAALRAAGHGREATKIVTLR